MAIYSEPYFKKKLCRNSNVLITRNDVQDEAGDGKGPGHEHFATQTSARMSRRSSAESIRSLEKYGCARPMAVATRPMSVTPASLFRGGQSTVHVDIA